MQEVHPLWAGTFQGFWSLIHDICHALAYAIDDGVLLAQAKDAIGDILQILALQASLVIANSNQAFAMHSARRRRSIVLDLQLHSAINTTSISVDTHVSCSVL